MNERVKDIPPSQYILLKERGYDSMQPHLSYPCSNQLIHKMVVRILLVGARKSLPYSDMVGSFIHMSEIEAISDCLVHYGMSVFPAE